MIAFPSTRQTQFESHRFRLEPTALRHVLRSKTFAHRFLSRCGKFTKAIALSPAASCHSLRQPRQPCLRAERKALQILDPRQTRFAPRRPALLVLAQRCTRRPSSDSVRTGAGDVRLQNDNSSAVLGGGQDRNQFAPRRGKVSEISHIGTYSRSKERRFYLCSRGLRSGSSPGRLYRPILAKTKIGKHLI
jgi:hypothetical protein